jgi:5'-nucleotidase
VIGRRALAALLLVVLALAGCGGGDDKGGGDDAATSTSSSTTETTQAEPSDVPADLAVLVTDDDGVAAPGIDAVVEGLRGVPGIQVTVVAPAADRSGTGGQTTPGPLPTSRVTTASGYAATAVDGFPADTIRAALDDLGVEPDLVVSGVNRGQNLGKLTDVSGTVGAARAAAARGIPALAVSAGLADPPDYATATAQALSWLEEHRDELAAGNADAVVTNMNVPTCPDGSVREVVEVPAATESGDEVLPPDQIDCASALREPGNDVEAFNNGYVPLSQLEAS